MQPYATLALALEIQRVVALSLGEKQWLVRLIVLVHNAPLLGAGYWADEPLN